jgi:two-component SAPR family response regulator
MVRLAPEQPDLWFELATLCAESGQMQDAIASAQRHLQLAPITVRDKAGALLQQLKQRLN